jgi:5-methylcytosine-specific restriction enzyme A
VARATEEWIGSSDDARIPPRIRLRVFDRAGGRCELCRSLIIGGRWECDHSVALVNGGKNEESNLRCVCLNCHKVKTKADVAEKSKIYRIKSKHLGIKPKKKSWGYGKNDKFKMKIGGKLVLR